MKKLVISSLFLITLALSIPMTSGAAISIGDSYKFNPKKASGSFEYTNGATTVSGETDKFRVGDTGIATGTIIEANVTNVASSSVTFDIYKDSDNSLLKAGAVSSSLGFALGLIAVSIYPFLAMGISEGTFNPIDVSKGVTLGDSWFFAPPNTNWQDVIDIYNNSDMWSDIYTSFGPESTLNATSYARWYDNQETLSFIVFALGSLVNTTDDTNLFVLHNLRFDYDVTTNVLMGYNMNTGISGTYFGEETQFSMVVQVAEQNYTRRLGAPMYVLTFGALAAMGIFIVFKKRQK
jgi:hypothetical protein